MGSTTSVHSVVLMPGDGIGPEVTAAVRRIFEAAQAPIRWIEHQAGKTAVEAGGSCSRRTRSTRSGTTAWP